MSGQSTSPFMMLTEKKRKTVTFDARDVLEKTSENMERMMVLMDKMYIKLDQKEVPYKPQIYQRGRGQNRRQFRQGNNWRDIDLLVEVVMKVIEDMEEEEVTFGEATFREVMFEVDIIAIQAGIGKIENMETI